MAEIYWLLEPETRKVRYVGCAKNSAKRIRSHWSQRNSVYRSPVKDWLQSLSEPPEFEVIQTVPDEQAQAAEAYWTKMLRQTIAGPELLNILDGRKMRVDTRRKIGQAQIGNKLSQEVRDRIGQASQGESNKSAKLTEDDVQTILSSSESYRILAE